MISTGALETSLHDSEVKLIVMTYLTISSTFNITTVPSTHIFKEIPLSTP